MAGVSPTQNTLKWLRQQGYTAEVVEKWIAQIKIRKDLFGFIDVLAVGAGETLAVQSTSWSNTSSRVKKIRESDNLRPVLDAGWHVIVQGWKKEKGRWVSKEIYVQQEETHD